MIQIQCKILDSSLPRARTAKFVFFKYVPNMLLPTEFSVSIDPDQFTHVWCPRPWSIVCGQTRRSILCQTVHRFVISCADLTEIPMFALYFYETGHFDNLTAAKQKIKGCMTLSMYFFSSVFFRREWMCMFVWSPSSKALYVCTNEDMILFQPSFSLFVHNRVYLENKYCRDA